MRIENKAPKVLVFKIVYNWLQGATFMQLVTNHKIRLIKIIVSRSYFNYAMNTKQSFEISFIINLFMLSNYFYVKSITFCLSTILL